MSYVESNLLPGEKVVYEGKASAAIYIAPILLIPLFGIGLLFLMVAILYRQTTEMAVTNKRVVMKTGWLSLRTLELNPSKIETCLVKQGIFERMCGYGTVTVVGTGGTKESFHHVSDPMGFRRSLTQLTASP